MRGPPKRQLGRLAKQAELASGINTAWASKLARCIEPAEREHGGRALRENLHAQTASPPTPKEQERKWYLKLSLVPLGAILGHLGASWSHPGAILGHLGGILARLGAILGHLGAILGASWAS